MRSAKSHPRFVFVYRPHQPSFTSGAPSWPQSHYVTCTLFSFFLENVSLNLGERRMGQKQFRDHKYIDYMLVIELDISQPVQSAHLSQHLGFLSSETTSTEYTVFCV